MFDFFESIIENLIFIFQRMNWLSVLDILLVSAVFFVVLKFLSGTQAVMLLRGILFLAVFVGILTTLRVLPAFSWLMRTALPALLFSIPVIFAPEIRHALERLGRTGVRQLNEAVALQMQDVIGDIVSASIRLADRKHGALIVLERRDPLTDYEKTGVRMDASVTPELLLQIFYPNTPLHDGAVIISSDRLVAASCVMPLSSSGVLNPSPDRQMGLRHRAALGISEASDAVALVVSEESGQISVVQGGKMIRRLDKERLENILRAFFKSPERTGLLASLQKRFFGYGTEEERENY